jgi:hypothetical protein
LKKKRKRGKPKMRIAKTECYKLTLHKGEPNERIAYANLTNKAAKAIKKNIRGESNRKDIIGLTNGWFVEMDIISDIAKVQPYKWKSKTMGNIVCTFSEVILQAWDSLIHYHTLDILWEYNKNGF